MKKREKIVNQFMPFIGRKLNFSFKGFMMLMLFCLSLNVTAQDMKVVSGVVTDENREPVPGATVVVKGSTSYGSVTDMDGKFSIEIPADAETLVVSFIGMKAQEVDVSNRERVNVVLGSESVELDDVVVVGYGQQKKESVVASITQTKGETLERAGGVSSVGAALTGNVPGVVTMSSTGMPGEEDPQILIRGQSTWNNSDPLILVDGIERPMSSVDISSVESISVLKDASATAVYGVRGANGVILITTKRGKEGKADIRVGANSTIKMPSKLPNKYDSYDMFNIRNDVIEHELGLRPDSWGDYMPDQIIDKYRNPADLAEAERYPNVDWQDVLFRDYAMSYNANINVSGGTDFVKYFASADFLNEGDLFEHFDSNRGYESGYGYNRLNVRSNLDFELTPTTTFKANLAGSYGVRKSPWGAGGGDYGYWIAAYSTAPNLFLPKYADGTWGFYFPNEQRGTNSARALGISGVENTTTNRITTDFTLEQDLGMLVKGLNFRGTLSVDNTFVEGDRGINDLYNSAQYKWIDPDTGEAHYKETFDSNTRFDFQEGINWSTSEGSVEDWSTYRKLFYQMQLNYGVTIGDDHDITAMGLFNRNEYATGSQIPFYREDWVFRTTYNYAGKYTLEYNGAYNGSEKFGPDYRFAFFSSGGLSWMISEENFMQSLSFLDMLKLRASYGEIGDDNVNDRWLYMNQWEYGGHTKMGVTGESPEESPYTWYRIAALGNPNIHWEKVQKSNIGVDFAFFNGLIAGNFDYFEDLRTDILLDGGGRAVPEYFGDEAPVANLGEVKVNGYELELRLNHRFTNGLRLWGNINMTHSENEILEADSPELLPDYQKDEGKQLGQTHSNVSSGYYNTWDEVYSSTIHNENDNQKLPGDYHIIDYNGDGIIDADDNIPYGFSSTPQNTYNSTVGFEWKGLSAFVQFYGVNNVTRQVVFSSFGGQNTVVYDEGTYWTPDNTNGDVPMPRWLSDPSGYSDGNRYMFDGSYLRLKNAEIAYTFDKGWVEKAKMESVRVFVNGNNLFVWTDMPDDRESNFAGTGWASQGAYPTVKRVNLGVNIIF